MFCLGTASIGERAAVSALLEMATLTQGDWVAFGDQPARIGKCDGAKIAVALLEGNRTLWRTRADVKPLFGTSGTPKALVEVGDWVKLVAKAGEPQSVAQVLRIEGGRVSVRIIDSGKTLWRGFADLTRPFDDAPKTIILSGGAASTGASTVAHAPPPPSATAAAPQPLRSIASGAEAKTASSTMLTLMVSGNFGGGLSVDTSGMACVADLKPALQAKYAPWANLPTASIRFKYDGETLPDESPLDPKWHDGYLMAMVLRSSGPVASTSPTSVVEATADDEAPTATGGRPMVRSPSFAQRMAKQRQERSAQRSARGVKPSPRMSHPPTGPEPADRSPDDPPCALCGRPVAKSEEWDVERAGLAPRLCNHARWAGVVFHAQCGGCFKCGSKLSLEVDAIGGIYCAAHMKQRIAAAGGPIKASDPASLLNTEKYFMRTSAAA